MYSDMLRELDPGLNEADLDKQVSTAFPAWFKRYVCESLIVKSILTFFFRLKLTKLFRA